MITKNFSWKEAEYSHRAETLNIDNSMTIKQRFDCAYFTVSLLQPLRSEIGRVFNVSSWYRCPALNKSVGGVPNSSHLTAMACDFSISGLSIQQAYESCLETLKMLCLDYDQLIIEKNTKTGKEWVHLGLKRINNRKQHFYYEVS